MGLKLTRSRVTCSIDWASQAPQESCFLSRPSVWRQVPCVKPSKLRHCWGLGGGFAADSQSRTPQLALEQSADSSCLTAQCLPRDSTQEARLCGIQSDPKTAEEVLGQPPDPCLKTDRQPQVQEAQTGMKRRTNSMKAKGQRAKGRTDPRGNAHFRQQKKS